MFFNETIETLALPHLRQLQHERLAKMLANVYQNVPFYKQQMDELGIKPADIKGVEELHKLPFTQKTDLSDN